MKGKKYVSTKKPYNEGCVDGYVAGYWDGYYNRYYFNSIKQALTNAYNKSFKGIRRRAYVDGYRSSYDDGFVTGKDDMLSLFSVLELPPYPSDEENKV